MIVFVQFCDQIRTVMWSYSYSSGIWFVQFSDSIRTVMWWYSYSSVIVFVQVCDRIRTVLWSYSFSYMIVFVQFCDHIRIVQHRLYNILRRNSNSPVVSLWQISSNSVFRNIQNRKRNMKTNLDHSAQLCRMAKKNNFVIQRFECFIMISALV